MGSMRRQASSSSSCTVTVESDSDVDVESLGGGEAACRNSARTMALVFFVLGAGLELPYQALILAVDFFKDHYDGGIVYSVTVAFDPTALLTLVLLMKGLDAWLCSRHLRCAVVFVFEAFLLMCIHALPRFKLIALPATLACVSAIGVGTALQHFSVFGFAAESYPRCVASLSSGLNFSGVIASFIRLATKLLDTGHFGHDIDLEGAYFGFTAMWCLACAAIVFGISPPLDAWSCCCLQEDNDSTVQQLSRVRASWTRSGGTSG
ncbi:unnamed protein product [Prorocentrum cordatum]|uniref:Solute carrier family 40 protein n=1 Tax=Prorocentrum cordatum TaxID=2364126 RepID=A0ABN9P968_9DINO|nr:unnamed protein product [Polarella glacialis]